IYTLSLHDALPIYRNTHFTIVNALYFCIKGFTNTMYAAQDIELVNTIASPFMVSEPNEKCLLNSNNNKAPAIPKAIPAILLNDVFSFKSNDAINNTKTGLDTMMMDALIGVVRLNPFKNKI